MIYYFPGLANRHIYIHIFPAWNTITRHSLLGNLYFFSPFLNWITERYIGKEKSSSLSGSHCSLVGNEPGGIALCGSPNPWHLLLFSSCPQLGKAAHISRKLSPGKGERISPLRWPSEAWQEGGIRRWGMRVRKQDARGGGGGRRSRQKPPGSEM